MLSTSSLDHKVKELEDLFVKSGANGFHAKAWDHFLELGLPEKKDESFQYVPVRQLYDEQITSPCEISISQQEIEKAILPECKQSYLIFLNGDFQPDLSCTKALPKQVVLLPMQDALRSYGNFLQGRLVRGLKEETDPFTALNLAFSQKGAFLFVPPKVVVENPIQCLHFVQGKEGYLSLITPRVHLFLGKESKINWIQTVHALSEQPFLFNGFTDVALEECAEARTYSCMTELADTAWYFESLRASLKGSSSFHSLSIGKGAKSTRQDFKISLLEENAQADLQGICLLEGKNQAHTKVTMNHFAPHTRSMQRFKGVLKDISQSSFQGIIFVAKEAQKTEAYQLNNNLILGERAIANSKPGLEIFADDVKASHGATIAQLDASHLFYLKSRGFSESDAKKLLVMGFCKEILDLLPYSSLQKEINTMQVI